MDVAEIAKTLGSADLAGRIHHELERAPEPEAAARRSEDLLSAVLQADRERLARAAASPQLCPVLRGLCGTAPFLARHVGERPDLFFALLEDDLRVPRSYEHHVAALEGALASGGEPEAVLRHYKYAELARLCIRDASEEWVPLEASGETLREISALADALLERAFDVARGRVAERFGPARWSDGERVFEPGLAVLGLGKLGGGELNFSSDVDLIYVFESPPAELGPHPEGPEDLSLDGWATRVLVEFGHLVSDRSDAGFLYRIDLDLRPEGADGPRVIGSNALAAYYDGWAALWEKAAFTKARPVAGDLAFGWQIVRRIHPMIYRSTMDYSAVNAIHDMKLRVEEAHTSGEGFHVKLGTGGIRDVEFVAQAHQLLHGGRIPDVRGRSTQHALGELAAHGILDAEQARALLAAYRFLRRLENRLQMEEERQVHRLAAGDPARTRAARAMGYVDEPEAFEAALESHRAVVRDAFSHLFAAGDEERVLELFERGAPRLLLMESTRSLVVEMSRHFAREIGASANPDLALNNLDRFIDGVGTRTFFYGLLLDRPELVTRITNLFGASRYLSNLLAAHPELIEPVFHDPEVLLLAPQALREDLGEVRQGLASADADPVERELAALRLFHHRQLVNVGLLDLDGRITRREAEGALSDLAETCIDAALELARAQVKRGHGATTIGDGDFCVVGMGKLGSRELSYGSDLDVIFLYDVPGADESTRAELQADFARLAQKLIGALDTPTAQGSCYSVDARLRPSGGQGALVTSLDGFREHHATNAMAWERQALLRARAVSGDPALAERFEAARREILERENPPDLAGEIRRIRTRMEEELGRETRGRLDLKVGRGGLVDVEFAVQFLQLAHGHEHPALFDPESIETQLERLAELGLLAPQRAAVLRDGWEFLQRLSSRLRIVHNRSISDLREDRSDLDAVARTLGYAPSSRSGDARRPLFEDYKRHTDAIRAAFLEILGQDPA